MKRIDGVTDTPSCLSDLYLHLRRSMRTNRYEGVAPAIRVDVEDRLYWSLRLVLIDLAAEMAILGEEI